MLVPDKGLAKLGSIVEEAFDSATVFLVFPGPIKLQCIS